MKNILEFSVATVMFLVITGQDAQAYIDPGSGSIIMSLILGLVASIAYTARKYFYKLKNVFKKKDTAVTKTESNEE